MMYEHKTKFSTHYYESCMELLVCVSYSSDEAVKWLPPLGVLHRDRAQIITEPNGWDDASGVTVSHVFLMKKTAVIKLYIAVIFLPDLQI